MSPDPQSDRRRLRRQFRDRRRALTPGQQQSAADAVAQLISDSSELASVARCGLYQADDGELDPADAAKQLRLRGAELFYPAIVGQQLQFAPLTATTTNRFGIIEPDLARSEPVPLASLDVLFMPLVAFDDFGTRLGRGGGFYDRALAELLTEAGSIRPWLIGLAHNCQRSVAALPRAAHDYPLDAILTPAGQQNFAPRPAPARST